MNEILNLVKTAPESKIRIQHIYEHETLRYLTVNEIYYHILDLLKEKQISWIIQDDEVGTIWLTA